MAQTISADFTSTIVISISHDLLIIKEGVVGNVAGVAVRADGDGIDRKIRIEGAVHGVDENQPACIGVLMGNEADTDAASHFRFTVTETGEVSGLDFGVRIFSEDALVDNSGLITGAEAISGELTESHVQNAGRIAGTAAGIGLGGSGNVVENSGRISATIGSAVLLFGDNNSLVNTGTIAGGTDGAAVFLDTSSSAQSRFVNTGKVTSGGTAFESGVGLELVINRGRIEGDIVLGEGGDTFINARGATVTGTLFGAESSDFYILHGRKVAIVEEASGGVSDAVAADFNYRIGSNIEELVLMGRKNINGTGNGIDNEIQGNSGNNTLSGLFGEDLLNGHAGNDRLIGGADGDTFYFEGEVGRDVIVDFEVGETIDLTYMLIVPDDAALAAATRQRGSDVVIDLGNGESIRILNADRDDVLDASITQNGFIN